MEAQIGDKVCQMMPEKLLIATIVVIIMKKLSRIVCNKVNWILQNRVKSNNVK